MSNKIKHIKSYLYNLRVKLENDIISSNDPIINSMNKYRLVAIKDIIEEVENIDFMVED